MSGRFGTRACIDGRQDGAIVCFPAMRHTAPMRVILSGPPSAGKSTQGRALALEFGVPHVSSGALIREGARTGDPVARMLADAVADGSLAPSGEIVDLVLTRLARLDARDGFVLDGFPRRVEEAMALLERFGGTIDAFVVMEASVGVLERRRAERARQGDFIRADDDPDYFPHRIARYLAETRPVREYFASAGIPVLAVDAEASMDAVSEELRDALACYLSVSGDVDAGAPTFF